MKNKTLLLVILLCSNMIFGQTEKPAHKIVADKFEAFYNEGRYDSIFVMYSEGMQKFQPLARAKEFLGGTKTELGKITQRQFLKYKSGVAVYKADFERGTFEITLFINKNSKIDGLRIIPYVEEILPKITRNSTKLILPFKDEWTVNWGGDTEELNYHVQSKNQKNAFDFSIMDAKGKTFKTDRKTNEDFYAFGKELIAPCDGEIILAVDGVKDNIVGEMNTFHTGGNSIILKNATNEYLVFCHFKQNSIVVKQGQKVKQGQLLGLCGNSGNSSEPHLHFHIQNVESMNEATGVKCYFDKLLVNGILKNDYSPIKNEKIKNE